MAMIYSGQLLTCRWIMTALWQWTVIGFLITLQISGGSGWPEGTYGIPMSKSGCPQATRFDWQTGSRTHHTENGSHGSPEVHLAGIYSKASDRITQSFCMKTVRPADGAFYWMEGKYCIYKMHECPNGFRTGWIYWDDAAPFWSDTIQNKIGVVPDGEYDRNTKIHFCCRNDGSITRPIVLPTASPFHLVMHGEGCQLIQGMDASEEWVYWRDDNYINMNSHSGLYPRILRLRYPVKYTKIYYCYYEPLPESNTFEKALLAIYVIAGIVGTIILLLVLMCIAQRLLTHKPKEYEENNLANAMRERMLRPHRNLPAPEPVVHYRRDPEPNTEPRGRKWADEMKYRQFVETRLANGRVPSDQTQTESPQGPPNGVVVGGAAAEPSTPTEHLKKIPLPAGKNPVVIPTSDSEDSALSSNAATTPSDESTPMLPPPTDSPINYSHVTPAPPSYEDVLREDGRLV